MCFHLICDIVLLKRRSEFFMIKAVVFDAFDTLFKVEKGASAKYIINCITKSGHFIDEAEFHKAWKDYYVQNTVDSKEFKTERDIFTSRIRMFYDKYGLSRSAVTDANFLTDKSINRKAFDDVNPTLEYLKTKCSVYIGSNTDNDVLFEVMKNNGVAADKIYTSESLMCYKPSKRFYETIVNENGLHYDEVLFVGDSLIDDVFGPQQVNIKTCWLNRTGNTSKTIVPDYEIHGLTELTRIIR